MKIIRKVKPRAEKQLKSCSGGDVVTFPEGFYNMGAEGTPYIVIDEQPKYANKCMMRSIMRASNGRVVTVNDDFRVERHKAELHLKGVVK